LKSREKITGLAAVLLASAAMLGGPDKLGAARRYQADNWIAECDGPPGSRGGACSMTVPFWQTAENGQGSFALVVMLQTGDVGLVGTPAPVRAVLRIDQHPEAVCRGERYCIFPIAQSRALLREFDAASLIKIDVFTAKSRFSFILSPDGYRAGMAEIRAWGYRLGEN
jgi:hypothetical protein